MVAGEQDDRSPSVTADDGKPSIQDVRSLFGFYLVFGVIVVLVLVGCIWLLTYATRGV